MSESLRSAARSPAPRARRVWRRRLAHVWWDHQWPILIAMWVWLLVLGYIGFWKYYQLYPGGKPDAPGDLIYYTMQLIPMISGGLPNPVPWELETSRHLLPILEGYAGVAALVMVFSSQVQGVRLRMTRGHVVICGLGHKGLLLARRFHDLGLLTVVIENDRDNSSIEQCRDEGIVVLIGDAADSDVLAAAGITRAAYLISVCRDDGTNARVAIAARRVTETRRGEPLTCIVHVVDPQLCELLREGELKLHREGGMRPALFNVLGLASRAMLAEHPPAGDDEDGRRPHVLIVGLGRFGRSVVLAAARNWQPRFRASGERLRMTLLGKHAKGETEALCERYPRLAAICELTAQDVDVRAPGFHSIPLPLDAEGRCEITAAYVCVDDESVAISTGLSLLECLRDGGSRIVVRVNDESGLAVLLPTAESGDPIGRLLHTFPVYERTCSPEMVLGGTHETLARAIHMEYVSQQTARGDTPQTNPSLVPWDDLPPRLQDANRHQADDVGFKLAALGCRLAPLTDWDADRFSFSPEEIEELAEKEHERWMKDYLSAGWVYAPGEKQNHKKTHPSLVPWGELSEEEKDKDRDTIRSLPVFLARTGFQIERQRGAEERGRPVDRAG